MAERLLQDYPTVESFNTESTKAEPRRKGKLRSVTETDFTPFMRLALHQFNSSSLIQFLEQLSGIRALCQIRMWAARSATLAEADG